MSGIDYCLVIALACSFAFGDGGSKIAVTVGFIMFWGDPDMYDLIMKVLMNMTGN